MSSQAGAQADRKVLPERDKGEAERLFRSWKAGGDGAYRDKIICQHLYLVQAVARKFTGLGESPEDLISEGVMGLINAVDLFDPDRGVQFATYATHLIDGQIRHYLRDKSKMIREPAWIQERLTRIARAAEALTHKLGRPATLALIAEAVDLSERQVREALKAQQRSRVASLDTTRMGESDDSDFRFDPERLAVSLSGESGLEVEDRLFLEQAMERLKPLEQKVLHHFYYLDLNQTEIARKLGISVNYASYLLRGALTKLKQAFEAQSKVALETASPAAAERRCPGTLSLYSLNTPAAQEADSGKGVAPEAFFRQLLRQEVLRASRYPQQFAVMLLEPDKAAQRGEAEMAAVMGELIQRTRRTIRMVDVVSRLGRWRLGLLLPHTGRQAEVVAERLRQPIGGFTVSLGLAIYPADGATEADLEAAADRALLEAQKSGGGRVCRAAALPPAPVKKSAAPRKRRKVKAE